MEIAGFSERFVRDAPDAIIYADAQGLIQFWNRSAERIFGFSEAEALGVKWADANTKYSYCGEQITWETYVRRYIEHYG